MPNGNGIPPAHIMGLFTQANYRFSSQAPNRTSTFYFSDFAGNYGRFRREHARGPELCYQGLCERVFISPELEAKLSLMADLATLEDADQFNEVRYEKLNAIYPMLHKGDPDHIYTGKATTAVTNGWRLFDSNGTLVHMSAGRITTADPAALIFFGKGGDALLRDYSGPWSVW